MGIERSGYIEEFWEVVSWAKGGGERDVPPSPEKGSMAGKIVRGGQREGEIG
jgi:hypothetical protein